MPRPYTPRIRAETMAATRARILETAELLLPGSSAIPVDRIAAEAGVSVQTLYTHFGSKRGLLLAVIDHVQRRVGLYADFDRVWQSADGETALRRMIEATFGLWDRAWPYVEFTERARRSDPDVGRYLREVDGYRRLHLRSITDRLATEARLRAGLDAQRAADAVFALTVPSVYDELVRVGAWSLSDATAMVATSAVVAVVEPTTSAVTDPPADWSAVATATELTAGGLPSPNQGGGAAGG